MIPQRDTRVAIVIPVKRLDTAKSRTGLDAAARADLALDLLRHTVTTAVRCDRIERVVIVTPDPHVAAAGRALGVVVLEEPIPGGLDVAARRGIAAVRSLFGVRHAGVLMSDLPELTGDDLSNVVAEYVESGVRLYVADQHLTGTTFLLQESSGSARTAFGLGSAGRHEALGFRPATAPAPGLRFDIDTADDLRRFRAGPRSARLRAGGNRPGSSGRLALPFEGSRTA